MSMLKRALLGVTLLLAAAAAANAQLGGLPGAGAIDRVVGGTMGAADRMTGSTVEALARHSTGDNGLSDGLGGAGGLASALNAVGIRPLTTVEALAAIRGARLDALVASNRAALDVDGRGQPVRRDVLIAANPTPADLALAGSCGFTLAFERVEPELGFRMVGFRLSPRLNVRKAFDRLRRADPSLALDFDHIYEPAGGPLAASASASLAGAIALGAPGRRIAMVDGGVASHPSLRRALIEQRGFAGAAVATGHGTAVASLLVGDQNQFRGSARGAQLFVADVFGGNPAAGSTSAIVRGLAWAASKHPSVITMSLTGPDNRVLGAAIAALLRHGVQVVAAVGNDGPAAPAAFPASYSGVVAVTGVDARGRALMEAGRAAHVDFAAPGADLLAASPGHDFIEVRGTSFAAPLAAGRLAAAGSIAALAAEAQPGKGRIGRGIVCGPCAVRPNAVPTRK